MNRYGYTIGVSYWVGSRIPKVWVVPYVVDFEEIVEHMVSGGVRVC